MNKIVYLTFFVLILLSALMLEGCSNQPVSNSQPITQANTQASTTTPAFDPHWKRDIIPADLERIKWLEGTWRGTGEGQEPFFERYTFENNSMTIETFSDSSLKKITETTRYALVNGEFRHTKNEKRTAASEITDDHIQFVPVVGDGNRFRFEKQPEGKWRAVLEWPATADKPAKQVIYNMEPYKK